MVRKRTRDDDPTKSDSDDEDYDNRMTQAAPRPSRKKPSAPRQSRSKPASKKRRTGYNEDESEEVSESSLGEESFEDSIEEAEQPELNSKGRPVRSAVKKKRTYEESDEEDIDDISSEEDVKSRAKPPPAKRNKMIIKLKVDTRNLRSSSAKATPLPSAGLTRRSSRITRDASEELVALSTSGKHTQTVRHATASPVEASRPTTGLKKPPSAIMEETEESSARTKLEPDETEAVVATQSMPTNEEGDEEADEDEQVADAQEDPANANEPNESAVVLESQEDAAHDAGEQGDEDDDEEDILARPKRSTRQKATGPAENTVEAVASQPSPRTLRSTAGGRATRGGNRGKKRGVDDTSDFEPAPDDGGDENVSDSDAPSASPRKASQEVEDSSGSMRRSKRLKRNNGQRGGTSGEGTSDDVENELENEVAELQEDGPRRTRRRREAVGPIIAEDRPTRRRNQVDYRVMRPEYNQAFEEEAAPIETVTPSKRGRGGANGAWGRSLFSTHGPFGGAGGPAPVLGGPGAVGGADSDSSDDDAGQRARPSNIGGAAGMTPTSGQAQGFGLFPPAAPQAHSNDPIQSNFGKVKDKQALADSDPLGVDPNVNFDSVGGLENQIDHLKEMVALPLLYPEIFQRFKVTPPRGVLFHGPPGTGKTLLARALASSVSSHGRKVTFYMRKGADALSKWVGEAERQLRLLFDEARKTQPSIIFFDEIDGLAPVRSSKQDQIHSSIVSTLLALMDGMDGRGQVIVIGATNRPDSVDPALRRPGRFDREFYFPLPNKDARRKILEIHTKDWNPPIEPKLKDDLADKTKGYGGADLRALCTEAALNAVQRRYPQIYRSNEKLLIKPETINVSARDFMISVKNIVPSSERSASSGAAPLPPSIEPLLREALSGIKSHLADILPLKSKLNALEEAQYEDAVGDHTMEMEAMKQDFERTRIFRPRLLVRGLPGMGQQYLAGALLHHFEGFHVQSFDLPILLGDSTRSAEAAIVQLFTEVKRHKPSVIFIPNVDTWYETIGSAALTTFLSLLRSIPPTDPVLLLGIQESRDNETGAEMTKDLFGFSKRNKFELTKPSKDARLDFFKPAIEYINKSPESFPDPADRRKRVLETLLPAPKDAQQAPKAPTKEELRAQRKRDRYVLSLLKRRIQPIMDQIRLKYKKFRFGVIDDNAIQYLFVESDPATIVTSDVPNMMRGSTAFRPYEKSHDEHGETGLTETASGKFFYNMETVTIEKRLSNGYYKRPKDFLADIKKLTKDAKAINDPERLLKANELQSNVEVDVADIENAEPALVAECEAVYRREKQRERELMEKAKATAEAEGRQPNPFISNLPPEHGGSTTDTSGAILLGAPHTNGVLHEKVASVQHISDHSTLTNGVSDLTDLSKQHGTSNGTNGPSRGSQDVQMGNSDESNVTPIAERGQHDSSSFGQSAQTRPLHMHTAMPSSVQNRASMPGSLSQRSAITPMAPGTAASVYENSASTTSSDKHNTGSSGPYANESSQALHQQSRYAAEGGPSAHESRQQADMGKSGKSGDIDMLLEPAESHHHLPDTQEEHKASQASTNPTNPPHPSQASNSTGQSGALAGSGSQPPVPLFPRTNDGRSLLNEERRAPPHPPLVQLEPNEILALAGDMAHKTSPCSVEQLEQIYSALMNELWRSRGQWDRREVATGVRDALNDVLEDMRAVQDFGPASAESLQD